MRADLGELVRRTVEDTLNGLAGVSARRIENVSEILLDSIVSVSTVSNINEKDFASVEEWRNRPSGMPTPTPSLTGST